MQEKKKSDLSVASPALGFVFSLSKVLMAFGSTTAWLLLGCLQDLEPHVLPGGARGKGWQLFLALCWLVCYQ